MAKFTELFGRKGGETGAGRGNGNGNGEHSAIETFSDVGSRMGEENEALRNLLTDTGRKIGELDELKEAFDKIVAPFNSTLRALEQEKSQSLAMTGMLNESRAAYEALRTEYYQIEKRRPRSKPRRRDCAPTSNWRASRTGAWKARASNCRMKSPPAAPRSPSSSTSWSRRLRSAAV